MRPQVGVLSLAPLDRLLHCLCLFLFVSLLESSREHTVPLTPIVSAHNSPHSGVRFPPFLLPALSPQLMTNADEPNEFLCMDATRVLEINHLSQRNPYF